MGDNALSKKIQKIDKFLAKVKPKEFQIRYNPFDESNLEVIVFKSYKDLKRFLYLTAPGTPKFRACLCRYSDKKNMGLLMFCKELATQEVIIHECVHAAYHYFRLFGLKYNTQKFDRKKEEKFCSTVEYLYSQIINNVDVKKNNSLDDAGFEFFNAQKFYDF